MKSLSVGQRLSILVVTFSVVLVLVGFMGLKTSADTLAGLKTVYEDRTVAMTQLTPVVRTVREILAQLALALQHDPHGSMVALHDHPIEQHTAAISEGLKFVDVQWKKFIATSMTPEEKTLSEQVTKLLEAYEHQGVQTALNLIMKGDFSANTLGPVFMKTVHLAAELRDPMIHLVEIQVKEAEIEYNKALVSYQQARTLSITLIVLGMLGGSLFAWLLIRSITRPLNEIRDIIVQVQQNNDFTLKVPLRGQDEIGQMAQSFNEFLATLRASIGGMLTMIGQVGSSAGELSQNSKQAAGDASEATSSMAAAVEEMTVSINHVGESSREALTLATQAGEYSGRGGEVIRQAIGEINTIAATSHEISETIAQLGEHSQHISGVIQVIKDVADQTNLLALNAAIEAARAGESGRGFAVVADEVRKLAERTAQATGEISQTVTAIQNSTQNAVTAMGRAVAQVDHGVQLAGQAGESINQIGISTNRVVEVVSTISESILEQASASNSISTQVERVAQASEENSAVAQNSADSAHHVAELSAQMREAASRFHI